MSKIEKLRLLTSTGFSVVRLRPDSKIPTNKNWQQRATDDLSKIQSWGERCNYGVLTGTVLPNGKRFVVLDVDNKNGKNGSASFERLTRDFRLEATAFSESPNGGEHHYYLVPDDIELSGISKLLSNLGYNGIDFLGIGLQVVESPSRLPSGSYRWIRSPAMGLKELSASLQCILKAKELQTRRRGKTKAKETRRIEIPIQKEAEESEVLTRMIQRFKLTDIGHRNYLQTKVVGHLFSKNYPVQRIRSVVRRWLAHFERETSTPLDEAFRHAEICIESTLRKVNRGEFELSTNHEREIANQHLDPLLKKFLDRFCHHLQVVNNGKRNNRKSTVIQERRFIQIVLLTCQYQSSLMKSVSEIRITDRQIRDVWSLLFRESIEPKQNERLKKKFFTRPNLEDKNRKAQKLELLSMKSKGKIGTPSVYVPSRELEMALRAIQAQHESPKA